MHYNFTLSLQSLITIVTIGIVNQGLKVMNFKDVPPILVVLNEGVDALVLITVAGEETLDLNVVKEVLLGHAKDLESLLLGYKAALNSKAFLGNFFPKFVAVPICLFSTIFLLPEISNFCQFVLLIEQILPARCIRLFVNNVECRGKV